MPTKKVKYLLPAVKLDMGGFPVKQPLPTQKIQQVDPFLLLHHANAKYSILRPALHQGIGPHPHRGFSPVTFVINGEIHHRDSRGNSQIAKQGEVQWMHAGMGIVHSERPSQELVNQNGWQEIIQLWINSPAIKKMIPPSYQYLPAHEMPIFSSEDKKVISKLVVGEYGNQKGKIHSQSELLIIWVNAQQDGEEIFNIPTEDFNCMLYVIKGDIVVENYGLIEKEHLAIFDKEGKRIKVTAKNNTEFIIFCGVPIDEEVTQYGSFVMNTQTEIMESMRDYQMGKMGILIEE